VKTSANTAAMVANYRRHVARRLWIVMGAGVVLLTLALADLMTGPSPLTAGQALQSLLAGPDGGDRLVATIVWSIRLPMTLMAILVGISLGVAGLQMQTILNNPLASPFTLGFSAAAGFGAALAIMFGAALPIAVWIVAPLSAFAMTLVACVLIYAIARLRGASAEVLVLGGIAIMFMFQALQSLLQYIASPEVLQQIVFWLFGSLARTTWSGIILVFAVLLVVIPLFIADGWRLTAMRLGDAHARSLGVDVDNVRRRTFILVAFATAASVAFVGTIGFIGLVAPHIARSLVGDDQRSLLPLSALAGAILMAGASVVSKVIAPGTVIPIGIVTAIIGVPMLFGMIIRGKRVS